MILTRLSFLTLPFLFFTSFTSLAVSDLLIVGLDQEREILCIDLPSGALVKTIPVRIKPWEIMGFEDHIYVINFQDYVVHRYPYEGGDVEVIPLHGRPIGLVHDSTLPYVVLEPKGCDRDKEYVATLYDLQFKTTAILPNGDYRFTNHTLFIKCKGDSKHIKFNLEEMQLQPDTFYKKKSIGLINAFKWQSIFYTKSIGYGYALDHLLIINTEDQESTVCRIGGWIIRQIIPYQQGILLLHLSDLRDREHKIFPVSINPDAPSLTTLGLSSKSVISISLYWGDEADETVFGLPFPEYKHPHQDVLDDEGSSSDSGSYVEPEPARISSE